MKNRKNEKKRRGCLPLLAVVLIFAVGFCVGNRSEKRNFAGDLPELAGEYASRGFALAKGKLRELLVKDGDDGFFADLLADKEEDGEEFTEIDGVDYRVSRLLYDGLSEDGKYVYRALYNAALTHKTRIFIPTVEEDELRQIHSALKYDNPQIPCFGDEFSYGHIGPVSFVKPCYNYTADACGEISAQMIAKAKELCAKCADRDEFGRELYLHDALVSDTVYSDEKNSSHCAAGALLDGEGVCASYALAMKLLMDVSGIESCVIQGNAEHDGERQVHVWLVVRVGDKWYHTDPTWDDPVLSGDKKTLVHSYFDLTTEQISRDHFDFRLPEGIVCDSGEANYFGYMGLMCHENDWRQVVSNAVYECLGENGGDVEFMFESDDLFERASGELNDGGFSKTVQNAVFGKGLSASSWTIGTQTFEKPRSLHYLIDLK